ncbi:hypothetical protein QVD17_17522 [Tagetes erecta]|uniref:Uncharacterized protein n=1 Tax=Tagetes erecta TaxID=13708 RepID=A0AAD8KTD3_TARER|nr:hypothetical protein QVD17_17522 [Tagetes erecta]
MPHPQIRTVTKNRTRSRRFSGCNRHPNEPVTGICALCLRDRLAGLDSASSQVEEVVVCSRRSRGHGGGVSSVPELRRSRSVAGESCKVLNDLVLDQRRKSCDVRVRVRAHNTLSDLFVVDDDMKKVRDGDSRVELRINEAVDEEDNGDNDVDCGIRVLDDVIGGNEIGYDGDCGIRVLDDVIGGNEVVDDDEVVEGDLKTMKEIIDMEMENKRRSLLNTASVFTQKLRKWRRKQKEKKQRKCVDGGMENVRSKLGELSRFRETQSEVAEYGLGRRSCDTEPRFSIDAHRLSVEDGRMSFDEHRASWDGYMIARTIPSLTPMLSVVDNMMLAPVNRVTNTIVENLQMHSISEDGASSGCSGQSNSDSSNSNRRSSSSSMKSSSRKTEGFGVDDVKSASNARVSPASDAIFQGTKLVITEKELKDWHLNSIKNNKTECVSNTPNLINKTSVMNPSNEQKKTLLSNRWRKVCNLWGHKQKHDDKNGEKKILEHIPENKAEIVNSSANLVRNPSCVNSRTRRDEFVLDRNRSTRYSTSDIDSGLLRLYLTPFRNSRRNKSGKSRAPSMVTNGF